MARKKVTLGWIAHDPTRRATFKKRKQSLLKKVSELATLCAIDACAVVYGPEDEAPEVWPSPAETARVAARFRAMPESDQSRKKTDQEGFLRQRAAKLREQLSRQDRGNRELEASLLMHELLSGGGWKMCDVGIEQTAELVRLAEMKLALVRNRVEREKARIAVEPPRQVVEQVVGMAVGPLIDLVKMPGQAVEQVVDIAEDPWIGFALPPLQAVEQVVDMAEDPWIGFVLPPLQAVEQVVDMAEDPWIGFALPPLQAVEQVVDMAEDPWIGFVLPPLQGIEQAVGTVEPEAEDETLNWLVEALNAGEIAPFADVGEQEAMALSSSAPSTSSWSLDRFNEPMFTMNY